MSDEIILTCNGSIQAATGRAGEDPLACLGRAVSLESGYTLRSFFRLIEAHPDLRRLNPFFPECLRQYRRSPAAGCVCDGWKKLVLSKTVEMIGYPGKPRLEIFTSFKGAPEDSGIELKAVGIAHLLDMSVRLGPLRHVVFGDSVDVFEFETVYTLFEFIDGIGWELGFHGASGQCDIQ